MEKGIYVEPNSLSGGLALWWKREIEVVINYTEESMIDTTIDMNNEDGLFHVTWIYGSKIWHDRRILWDKLRNIARTRRGS